MTRAFLSLGSNLGDRRQFLAEAVGSLGSTVVAVSPVYETDPVGGPEQGRFLNIVVQLETELSPRDLLAVCHRLESGAERVRTQHWGPRTLDVDIVTVADPAPVQCATERLTLPHPLAHERAFVLVPWLAADPSATLTVDGVQRPVAELVAALDPAERTGVRRTDLELSCG